MILSAAYVVLSLTVHDCDTGKLLSQNEIPMPEFSISGDRMEDCRKQGVVEIETVDVER